MNITCILGLHDWTKDLKKCATCGQARSSDDISNGSRKKYLLHEAKIIGDIVDSSEKLPVGIEERVRLLNARKEAFFALDIIAHRCKAAIDARDSKEADKWVQKLEMTVEAIDTCVSDNIQKQNEYIVFLETLMSELNK